MVKLTEAQAQALMTLTRHPGGAISITMWGGKPLAGMPSGIRSTATLWALRKRGLVGLTFSVNRNCWTITEAGRLALSQMEKNDGK